MWCDCLKCYFLSGEQMSRHFSAIGFNISSDAKLLDFARECVGRSDAYQSDRRDFSGAGFRWEAGRGIEVWTAVKPLDGGEDYEIVSCLPAWRCEETLNLRAWRMLRHPLDKSELLMLARFEDGRELSFALPNLWQNPELPARGMDGQVHLAGLALEAGISPFESAPRLLDERQADSPVKTLDSALIPLDRDNHYRVAGRILEADETSNIHSGVRLWKIRLDIDGLHLPLIFPKDISSGAPAPGLRFDGLIWLCGLLP